MKLKVLQHTFFKQSTADSDQLPAQSKVAVAAGTEFEIHSWKAIEKNHLRIAILNESLGNPPQNTWTIYTPHVQLVNSRDAIVTPQHANQLPRIPDLGLGLPKTKLLNVPYHSPFA